MCIRFFYSIPHTLSDGLAVAAYDVVSYLILNEDGFR